MVSAVPSHIIKLIEAAIDELRPQLGLGPTSRFGHQVAAPLIAASDPVHPSIRAFMHGGRIHLRVECVAAMHSMDELAKRGVQRGCPSGAKAQLAGVAIALAAVLASNEEYTTSSAALDAEGNICVRDSFAVNGNDLLDLRERLRELVRHAREIWQLMMSLRAQGLDLPDWPESPLPNGF